MLQPKSRLPHPRSRTAAHPPLARHRPPSPSASLHPTHKHALPTPAAGPVCDSWRAGCGASPRLRAASAAAAALPGNARAHALVQLGDPRPPASRWAPIPAAQPTCGCCRLLTIAWSQLCAWQHPWPAAGFSRLNCTCCPMRCFTCLPTPSRCLPRLAGRCRDGAHPDNAAGAGRQHLCVPAGAARAAVGSASSISGAAAGCTQHPQQ